MHDMAAEAAYVSDAVYRLLIVGARGFVTLKAFCVHVVGWGVRGIKDKRDRSMPGVGFPGAMAAFTGDGGSVIRRTAPTMRMSGEALNYTFVARCACR